MDYNGAVEVIKKAEAYDIEQRSVTIDLTALDGKIPIKEFNSKEVTAALNFVEKMEGKQPAQERAAVPVQTTQKQTTKTVRKANIMKDFEAAATEFQDAVSHIEGSIESATEKRSTSKLVLPNLSLNDQLSELEKINLGLDGNVFSKEQLKIIKEEARGLAKIVSRRKTSGGVDLDLEELRSKRLKEVLSKLGSN